MKLLDILAHNARVILWSDATEGWVYTWDYNVTFHCYAHTPKQAVYVSDMSSAVTDDWKHVDTLVLGERPINARQSLQKWHKVRMMGGITHGG